MKILDCIIVSVCLLGMNCVANADDDFLARLRQFEERTKAAKTQGRG